MSTTAPPNNCQSSFHIPNCASSNNVPFNHQNRFQNDPCYLTTETAQSTQPGMYKLHNFYDCRAQPTQTMDIALNQPLTQFKDGYGSVGQKGNLVDTHSSFRDGKQGTVLTNTGGPQTLYERAYLTIPYMGRGIGDPCTELALQEGSGTFERKQCNTLSEIHLPHQYTPMVDCLRQEIQNPQHIVPEDNQKDWMRGGYPSRQWVHNRHFDDRCPQTQDCRCPTPNRGPAMKRKPCPPRPVH